MREELVKRLIAQASDELIRAIYRRIVVEQRRTPFSREREKVESWEELVGRAFHEGVLHREEAVHLLEEFVKGRAERKRPVSRR